MRSVFGRMHFLLKRRGVLGLVRTVLYGGCVKRPRSIWNYYVRGRRYPQHKLLIVGFAKSGSTWFTNLVADSLGFESFVPLRWPLNDDIRHGHDLYRGMFRERPRSLGALKGHTWGFPENIDLLDREYEGKYFVTVRDPRDALVSSYWHIRRDPFHWDHKNVVDRSLHEYITFKIESGAFKSDYVDWLSLWLKNAHEDRAYFVRYEALLSNTEQEMRRCLSAMDMPVDDERIRRAVVRASFERKTGRRPGAEDTSSFRRRGISGEWREEFTDKQIEVVREMAGATLETLEYEV